MMENRPERLVYYKDFKRKNSQNIEALFMHEGKPILFEAQLPSDDREFYGNVFSVDEDHANLFGSSDLLDACFCEGCLEPENTEETAEVLALKEQCEVAGDENNLD